MSADYRRFTDSNGCKGLRVLGRVADAGFSEDTSMQSHEFQLTDEFIELHKLLKVLGVCESGGAAKALVAGGGVEVDGQRELRKACKIRAGQVVQTADARIAVVGA